MENTVRVVADIDNISIVDQFDETMVSDFIDALSGNGFNALHHGDIKDLVAAVKNNERFSGQFFISLSDGIPEHQHRKGQATMLLEMLDAHYAGSSPFVLLLLADKYFTKKLLQKDIVDTPNSILVTKETMAIRELQLPCVVKPNNEGSSLGIEYEKPFYDYSKLKKATEILLEKHSNLLVEEFVQGYEVTVFMIGNTDDFRIVEPVIYSHNGVYYFEDLVFSKKLKTEGSRKYHHCKSVLSKATTNRLVDISKRIFTELNCQDIASIDYRIDEHANIYFIEINGLPHIGKDSEFGLIANWNGLSFSDLMGEFARSFLKRINHG